MKSGMKTMEEGIKKVKGEVKHHAKPQGKEDKFIEKMKVCIYLWCERERERERECVYNCIVCGSVFQNVCRVV